MKPNPLRHVLVVDDNAEDRAELRSLLLRGSAQRWRFTEATTGAAALQALHGTGDTPFDCMLLDYHLPDMDAQAMLLQLCRQACRPPCPVLVVTGSNAQDGRSLVRAGAQDYIGKSWCTPHSLVRAVENAIERFSMQQEALRAQQELALERERLALALTAGQMGVFELNLANGHLVWSPEVYALFGVTPEVFKPTRASFRLLVHPEDRDIPWQMLLEAEGPRSAGAEDMADQATSAPALAPAPAVPAAAASTRTPSPAPLPATLEFRVQRPDGQWRWMAQRGQTEPDTATGSPRFFGVVFDITERKIAEAEQGRSSQRLHEQQFYTRSLIDSSIDGLVVTDTSGTVTDTNLQLEKLTGCTRAELVGTAFTGLFSDARRAQGCLALTLERLSLLDHELDLLSRSGGPTMVSLNGSTFYDRQRNLQGAVFTIRDVAQRHFLHRALQETNLFLEGARFVALKDRKATTELLLQSSQELLPQLQSILDCAERLHAGPPTPAPAQTATTAQMLQDSRLLLARVQAALGQAMTEAGIDLQDRSAVSRAGN